MSQATDNFTAAISQLDTDVKALIAQGGSGAAAAVDAFAVSAKASVDAIDAQVKAALNPATPPPNQLTFSPASVSIANGASMQLTVKDPSGNDVTATATYTVSDGSVASINSSGLVTGLKVGSTSGSAQSGANSGSFNITVA